MKIEQKESFKPITIALNTSEEAVAFWDIIKFATEGGTLEKKPATLARVISNWFSNESYL